MPGPEPDPSARATIAAAVRWNRTGIHVQAGRRCRLRAHGFWKDGASDPCDAAGAESKKLLLRLSEGLRRVPAARWFALVAAVDCDLAGAVVVGTGAEWLPLASGEVTCFANDVWFMYWNNTGSVELEVAQAP